MAHGMERGQAIVVIGLMLTLLVGVAALAIDGARAYGLRRDLQAALDSAALAAGDNLQLGGSFSSAERAASSDFGVDMRLYGAPSCTGFGAPGAVPFTVTCTYSDGTVLTEVVSTLGPQGSQFALTARRAMVLQFARILTGGAVPNIAAAATSQVNNLRYRPAIAALDQDGCGGAPGDALTISGAGTLNVIGDVLSNGGISVAAGTLSVGGDIYARCQSPVPGSVLTGCYPSGASAPCTYPDVAGATRAGFRLADPGYRPPAVVAGSQSSPGNTVVLSPGLYAADPAFSSNRCYFLAGGVYDWDAGYTNSSAFVSNELKPPDEPVAGNNTSLGHQMWDTGGVNCAGAFQVSAVAGSGIEAGSWGVEITATRTAVYAGTGYRRESAPSMCRAVNVNNFQVVQIQISNVPGAVSYNVYASQPPNGCSGPFGLAGSIPVTTSVQNNATAGCPAFSGTSCSLGNETVVFGQSLLGPGFAPNPFAAPGVIGSYPPAGEAPPLRVNLPNQNPVRAAPPGGDRANENQCETIVGAATACPGPVTPGAVEFYIPAGGCLSATNGGDNFLFSGYQYDWLMTYEPGQAFPPANTCSNVLGAAADSAWTGLTYMPSASLTVSKAATFRTEATGGLLADTISFGGQLPEIIYSANYAPVPPASTLVT